MTTEEALQFLRSNQPLPPTQKISEEQLKQFDKVRRHFVLCPDERSVPLMLNAFGEGDGHGVYQLVEEAILVHSEAVVVPALAKALRSPNGGVRYWTAQIAANYPRPELVEPLCEMLRRGNIDERLAAVSSLASIGTATAIQCLENALNEGIEIEVKEAIMEELRG